MTVWVAVAVFACAVALAVIGGEYAWFRRRRTRRAPAAEARPAVGPGEYDVRCRVEKGPPVYGLDAEGALRFVARHERAHRLSPEAPEGEGGG